MRSLGFWSVTFIAAANLALGACARSWPTVRPVGDPSFMARQSVVMTVDVLPLDIEIGARAGKNPEEIAGIFHAYAGPAIAETLQTRGYRVGAIIDWDGSFTRPGGAPRQAMTGDEVMATEQSLALFGAAQAQRPNELLFPYLPARLGATGSDATLYVGGYGYSGKDGSGITVGKVILGVLIVAVVVVVIAAALGGKGGGGGLGSAAGHAASAAGKAVGGVARVGLRAASTVVRVGANAAQALGNANINVSCCHHDPYYDYYYNPHYRGGGDAYGHGGGSVEIVVPVEQAPPGGPPATAAPQPQPGAPAIAEMPRSGGSRTYLEMTLVDNRTGRVLWHARQEFHANPGNPGDAQQVMKRMLATLPLRAGL